MNQPDPCIFCQIACGAIPVPLLLQTDYVVAFADRQPQAPHHSLVIPRRHTANLTETTDSVVLTHLLQGVQQLVREQGLTDYRLVVNTGASAGQSVFHLHLHVLAGRSLSWPPG